METQYKVAAKKIRLLIFDQDSRTQDKLKVCFPHHETPK